MNGVRSAVLVAAVALVGCSGSPGGNDGGSGSTGGGSGATGGGAGATGGGAGATGGGAGATGGGASATGGGAGATGGGSGTTGGGSACAAPVNGTALFGLIDVNGPTQNDAIQSGSGDNIMGHGEVFNGQLYFNSQDSIHSVSVDGGLPTTLYRSRGTVLGSPAVATSFGVRTAVDGGLMVGDDQGWQYSTSDQGPFTALNLVIQGAVYQRSTDALVGVATGQTMRKVSRISLQSSQILYSLGDDEMAERFTVTDSHAYFWVRSVSGSFMGGWRRQSFAAPTTMPEVFAPSFGANIELNTLVFADGDTLYVSATDNGATTQGDGVYRISPTGTVTQVIRTQALSVEAAANGSVVVFNIGGDFYVVPKNASAPVTKWFTPSTRTLSCISYGVALDATALYTSMYDSNSHNATVYRVPLP